MTEQEIEQAKLSGTRLLAWHGIKKQWVIVSWSTGAPFNDAPGWRSDVVGPGYSDSYDDLTEFVLLPPPLP